YRILTGRLPFDAREPVELARQHLEQPAPRPSLKAPLSPQIDAVVLRALEKRPERRFDSVADFLAALEAAVGRSSTSCLGSARARAAALEQAAALRRELGARAVADPRVQVAVELHAAPAVMRALSPARTQLISGEIARLGGWVVEAEVRGVRATLQALAGLGL